MADTQVIPGVTEAETAAANAAAEQAAISDTARGILNALLAAPDLTAIHAAFTNPAINAAAQGDVSVSLLQGMLVGQGEYLKAAQVAQLSEQERRAIVEEVLQTPTIQAGADASAAAVTTPEGGAVAAATGDAAIVQATSGTADLPATAAAVGLNADKAPAEGVPQETVDANDFVKRVTGGAPAANHQERVSQSESNAVGMGGRS